jgi:hypothetical protein
MKWNGEAVNTSPQAFYIFIYVFKGQVPYQEAAFSFSGLRNVYLTSLIWIGTQYGGEPVPKC